MKHHAWKSLILGIVAWLLGSAAAHAQKAPVPDSVELQRDLEYGKGGDRPLKMHILRPKTPPKDPMPVIVWIHGGGWRAGSRDSGIQRLAGFAQRGYFCASIEYRFSSEAVFPAQIEDSKCAIRCLRARAKDYHLDPDRIGVWGASAGGHLVALLGTTATVKELEGKGGYTGYSSRVQAVCDWFGPTDFTKLGPKANDKDSLVTALLGGRISDKKDKALLASPVTHITKDVPPFLLMHGDKDPLVPVSQSELFHEALKKAGVDSTLHVVKGAGHGFGGPSIDQMVAQFFDRHLKDGVGKSNTSGK